MNGGICLANGTCQYPQSTWLNSSTILSSTELNSLYSMVPFATTGVLLYKATRDGFSAKAFHDRCDNIPNTVTIIKNNLNFIFGGYTAARWTSNGTYMPDPKSFIFSLRRNGITSNYRLNISTSDISSAIYGYSSFGPTFGGGNDIYICGQSNIKYESHSQIWSYTQPTTFPSGSNDKTFLTGGWNNWVTTEIEVFQLSSSG